MNYASYRASYFVNPSPPARFEYVGIYGATLFFADYEAAIAYYSRVLGPPGYVEGDDTRGWQIGNSWLTLLHGQQGIPQNVEIPIITATPEEAERLQAAFIAAGGTGTAPSNQLMYEPIRSCPVQDPFGTNILIFSPLSQEATT